MKYFQTFETVPARVLLRRLVLVISFIGPTFAVNSSPPPIPQTCQPVGMSSRSVSASTNKVGYAEYGSQSVPPQFYLLETYASDLYDSTFGNEADVTQTYLFAIEKYPRPTQCTVPLPDESLGWADGPTTCSGGTATATGCASASCLPDCTWSDAPTECAVHASASFWNNPHGGLRQ
jgi:hypothetical protein